MVKRHLIVPKYITLFGTAHFPPVDNQGAIGSCASQSITENQFGNAVSRYFHKLDPDSNFSPRDHIDERFSPKYTYNLTGGGTAWVYEMLREQGTLCQDECIFEKNENGGAMHHFKDGKICTKSTSFPVEPGQMERAMRWRLKDFTQIWFTKEPYNEKLTTSEDGRKLLHRIKETLVRGDVVVTGGYPGRWVFGRLDGCGNLGKVGEDAVVAAAGNGGGGHQVTIVGYDDEVTCTFAGVKLRGAFLVVNSYGEGWQNRGLCWIMYDAVNTVSEFPALNDASLYSGPMYLTPAQNMSMFPESLTVENHKLRFREDGVCEVYGKTYQAFTAQAGDGVYLTYKREKGERELFLSNEKGLRFAFVPYEDITDWETTNKEYVKDEYKGSYWIYLADKDEDEEGFRMVDAGVSFTASGRKVGIATHNAGRYPEAKSWLPDCIPKGDFISRLAIAAGKDKKSGRIWALDQFCFINWEEDVVLGMPPLYVKVDVSATDRDCFKIYLTRKEKGKAARRRLLPAIFRYAADHPAFCDKRKGEYLNFRGELKGGECKGQFALNFEPLLPKNRSLSDFEWGIEFSKGRKGKASLLDAELVCEDKTLSAAKKRDGNKIIFTLK